MDFTKSQRGQVTAIWLCHAVFTAFKCEWFYQLIYYEIILHCQAENMHKILITQFIDPIHKYDQGRR